MRIALAVAALVLVGCGDNPDARCTPALAQSIPDLPETATCADGDPGQVVCFWPDSRGCVQYVTMPAAARCELDEFHTLCIWP